jgi:hypothetical protein
VTAEAIVPTGPAEALLLETFGPSLLAYVCGVSDAELNARLNRSAELRPNAESVLREALVPIAERVAAEMAQHEAGPAPAFFLPQILGSYDEGAGTSVGNALRLAAGGSLPERPETEGDPLAAVLLAMAADQYPVFLVPTGDDPWRSMSTMSLFRHPLRPQLDELVVSDTDLSQLFVDADPGLGRRGFVYTSLGRGSTLQSVMFGELILRSAWDSATMLSAEPTPEEFFDALIANLNVVRSAARGDTPPVRALLAFTGVRTEHERTIDTPWGDLRPLTNAERHAAPSSLEGAVSGSDQEGKHVTVSYAGELVLETELPYSLLAQPEAPADFGTWPKLRGADELRHRLEAVQLSALLALPRPPGSWVTARPAWSWIADPLASGRHIAWWDVRSGPAFMPYELNREECEKLGGWCHLIATKRTPAIDIAIRRVISVAHARMDPADRLVDSVIAWENLLGTREGEPTLRLSVALAWLLEPGNASRRESLQRRLKTLYAARSAIVHGNPTDDRRIAEQANEAFACALGALATLFRDRPEVLALPDGGARSLRLMLGGATDRSDGSAP